jgi:hypothetical protein
VVAVVVVLAIVTAIARLTRGRIVLRATATCVVSMLPRIPMILASSIIVPRIVIGVVAVVVVTSIRSVAISINAVVTTIVVVIAALSVVIIAIGVVIFPPVIPTRRRMFRHSGTQPLFLIAIQWTACIISNGAAP